jgi:hypothetical protein
VTGTRRAGGAKPTRRADPPPLEVDESRVILVGIVCWAIAFVVLLALHSKLAAHGNGWYPWTALAGIGLGCWGWYLTRKRVAARHNARPPDR